MKEFAYVVTVQGFETTIVIRVDLDLDDALECMRKFRPDKFVRWPDAHSVEVTEYEIGRRGKGRTVATRDISKAINRKFERLGKKIDEELASRGPEFQWLLEDSE